MENKTINIKMSDIVKVSFGWYLGKFMFEVTAATINEIVKNAEKKVKKPDIKVVKGKEETEE